MASIDQTGAPDADRRAFLKGAGRAAAVIPPAMTLLLTTGMNSPALAQSGSFQAPSASPPEPGAPDLPAEVQAEVPSPAQAPVQAEVQARVRSGSPAADDSSDGSGFGAAVEAVGGGLVGLFAFLGL